MKKIVVRVMATSLLVVVSNAWFAMAQDAEPPPITTERPTVGNSPDLIPARSLQVENGIGLSALNGHSVADLPETLVRLGVTNRFEMRFLASDEMYQKSGTRRIPTLQSMDAGLSAKVGLGNANSLYPRSAIVALSFPTGGPSWTSGSYDPTLTSIWTQTIHKSYFLNEIAEGTLTTLADARRAVWGPSIAGGRSLSQTLTGFAEYAPTILADRSMEYVVDGGFSLVRGRTTGFDVRTGYLKDAAGYHAIFSLGYSIRRDGIFRSSGRASPP